MDSMREWLEDAVSMRASDIFIGAGRSISYKLDGVITRQNEHALDAFETENLISQLYDLAHRSMQKFKEKGDDDFPVSIPDLARFRVSAYRQRGTVAASVRVVMFDIPQPAKLGIPQEVMRVASEQHGIVLVTGAAGNGKTTTLACIIDAVNRTRNCHIITLEDPIEYLHKDDQSLITQREIAIDTESYLTAIRGCLRQSPDIILLGEMRDLDTISAAMTAAETGHLVISTLHTVGAVNTIDRIIDVFPPPQQQQVRVQLSMLLKTVVSQQLLPRAAGGLIPAFEIMQVNGAIRNLIREAKTHQIDGVIQTSAQEGMIGMDAYLHKLYQSGELTAETAILHAANAAQMARRLGR